MAFISNHVFIIVSLHVLNVLSAPSITSFTEIKKESGCVHENRKYREGDKVQTSHPCLRCNCASNNLVCRLRVCIEVPDPPPPGCFILHHENECCPKLVCNSDMGYSSGANSIIESRAGSAAFQQKIAQRTGQGCLHNGTVYAEGSAMDTSSLCEYCYCIKGEQNCIKPQCLLSLPGCEPVYTKHACCPTKYNCSHVLPTTTSIPTPLHKKGCEVTGKYYLEGEMINGFAKQCENCYCLHGEIRCEPVICSIPSLSNQQCSPVYTPGHCCPSSYKCTSEDGDDVAETRHYNSVEIPDSDKIVEGVSERKAHHSINDEQRQIVDSNTTTNLSSLDESTVTLTSVSTSNGNVIKDSNNIANDTITTEISPTETGSTITMISINDTESTTIVSDMTTTLSTEIDEGTTLLIDENMIDSSSIFNETNEFSTSTMLPTDMTTLQTIIEPNENVSTNLSTSTSPMTSMSFGGYNYSKPAGYVIPDIEAIINITQNKEHSEDYEYDYNEPSLPPSLPNLKIIPFVAADAVVSKTEENAPPPIKYRQSVQYPIIHEKPPSGLTHKSERPVYYKVSHPNRFSPPTETEGGFVPHEPIIDHPFYESKIDLHPPYLTPGYNDDVTVPTITEIPSITQSQTIEKRCVSGGRRYSHGELISEPTSCELCTCFFGEIICQEPKCGAIQAGCIRLHDHALGCCGRVICGSNELESPTRVVDRKDHLTSKPPSLQQPSQHLPPFTIADLIVTPDPFRDVIRTKPAPDLPSLMGDIIHLWEHSTTQSSSGTLPSITTGSPEEAHSISNENDEIILNNLSTTNQPTINFSNDSLSINENLFTSTKVPSIITENITNSSTFSQLKDIDQTVSSQTLKEIVTKNEENTTPPIVTSTMMVNRIKEGENKVTSITSLKVSSSVSTMKPLEIEESSKVENLLIKIPTTLMQTTENLDDLKGEEKISDDDKENGDDFSFSSMLDLFFNSGNSDVTITPVKPSPFKLSAATTPITTEKTKQNTKLFNNTITQLEMTTKNNPVMTVTKVKNKFVANETSLHNNNSSSSSNSTKVFLYPLNKLDNTTPSEGSFPATVTENLKALPTTVDFRYPGNKNVSQQSTAVKLVNNSQNIDRPTVSNLKHPLINRLTTSNPLQSGPDPVAASGLLKLAGCNIYGRMYRVGRIISELSGPCLECMCTEVGVQCRPLPC